MRSRGSRVHKLCNHRQEIVRDSGIVIVKNPEVPGSMQPQRRFDDEVGREGAV